MFAFPAHITFVCRSGGVRGASVDVLRGSHGADFESEARVVRGRGYSFGTCFGLFSCGVEGVERRESVRKITLPPALHTNSFGYLAHTHVMGVMFFIFNRGN
jgi:hypothetical protein